MFGRTRAAAIGRQGSAQEQGALVATSTSQQASQRLLDAASWDAEHRLQAARSERRAWHVAIGAAALAVLGMGYGLAISLQPAPAPKVLVVDRQSGETVVLPNLDGSTVPQVVALDHYNAAAYVRAREGYNYSMLGRDFDQVARMSTPDVFSAFGRRFVGADAVQDRLADKELHRITVISVRLATGYAAGRQGEALVSYEREVRDQRNPNPTLSRHLATVRYEYRPSSMKRDVDRLENPLGFVVVAYRTDAEVAASRVDAGKAP